MGASTSSVSSLSMRLQIGLPKPTEKRSTLNPRRRATQKWPNSWITTRKPTAITYHSADQTTFIRSSSRQVHAAFYPHWPCRPADSRAGRKTLGKCDAAKPQLCQLREQARQHGQDDRGAIGRARGAPIMQQEDIPGREV